jgi:hypothetical protein
VLVPSMGIVPRQILSANDSRLMGASFVSLMGDAFVCRKHRQPRRGRKTRCRRRTNSARYALLVFLHAAPFLERATGLTSIMIKGHTWSPPHP